MPIGAIAPILGAVLPSLLGGISGAANPRPPTLSPQQSAALNQLLPMLMQEIGTTPKIDPIQQALMYGNIAQGQTGAENAVTHSLVSRGLGQSGILGSGLMQVANQAQSNRNTANLTLQEQAIQQRQQKIQDVLGLLGVANIPGQSGFGGFMGGLAPVLAYSLQNMFNKKGGAASAAAGAAAGGAGGASGGGGGGNDEGSWG